MTKRRWLWGILFAVIALGLLVTAGFIGYYIGVTHGYKIASSDEGIEMPLGRRFDFRHDQDGDLPGRFHEKFEQRKGGYFQKPPIQGQYYPGIRPFFSPFSILLRVGFLILLIWLGYKLFSKLFRGTGSGWQLTYQKLPAKDDHENEEQYSEKEEREEF